MWTMTRYSTCGALLAARINACVISEIWKPNWPIQTIEPWGSAVDSFSAWMKSSLMRWNGPLAPARS